MVSLQERLARRSAEELAEVAYYWGLEFDGPPEPAALAVGMASEIPVRTAFDRLDDAEKDVLRTMLSAAHRGWIVRHDIPRRTGLSSARADDVIASLERKAVAFVEERALPTDNPYWVTKWAGRSPATQPTPVLALPEETAPLFLAAVSEYAASSWQSKPASVLSRLDALPFDTLRAMATHYGVAVEDQEEPAADRLVGRLQAALRDHEGIWRVILALPPPLRSVLDAAEAAGGVLEMEQVRARFAPTLPRLHDLLRALSERALAYDRFVRRTRVLVVPERVLEAMARHTLPSIPGAQLVPADQPRLETQWQRDLHWALLLLIRHIRAEGLSRTASTRTIPKRTATRLTAPMRLPPGYRSPEDWIEQLVRYLAAVGVLPDPARLHLAAPRPSWMRLDVFSQAQALLDRWLDGHVEDIRQLYWNATLWMDRSQLAAGRCLLADLLRGCRPGQWYDIASLVQTAAAKQPYFLRERERLIRQHGYRGLKRMLTAWPDVEGRVVRLHLTGLPFELGMVALDQGPESSGPLSNERFALTPWGAALLGMAPRPPAPESERILVVQPNLEVVALDMVPEVLDTLGQFAVPIAYDQVATYRIERETVNLALAGGWTSERMLAFLDAHARTPVPQNVVQSLRGWEAAVRRARFRRVLVIESDDPHVLEELAEAPALRGHVRGLARGTVLMVAPDTDLGQISRDLRPGGVFLDEAPE